LDYINSSSYSKKENVFNVGTGQGYSVLEMLKAYEKACEKTLPYKIAPRRAGDIAVCFANPSKAQKILKWNATKTLEDMCNDSWKWQERNPNGYKGV
jgi:UDP-glucose 4-epimerase